MPTHCEYYDQISLLKHRCTRNETATITGGVQLLLHWNFLTETLVTWSDTTFRHLLLDISIYLFINQPGFGLGWCYFSSSGIYKLALVSVSVVWCHGGSDLTNIVQVEAEQGLRQFGTDGNAADNEDGGETGGIAGVLGTNTATMGILMGSTTVTGQTVGSGTINIEIETRGALGHRQSIPKPANWKLMTKSQRANWYKRKSD